MRKSAKQGIDGLEFEIILHGVDADTVLPLQPLVNPLGMEYGRAEVRDGKAQIGICLPKFTRSDNVKPYSISDLITLEIIRNEFEDTLKVLLGDIKDCRLKSIECNITQRVAQGCTPSQVMELIHRSYHHTTNMLYEHSSAECKYRKEKEYLSIPRRGYYKIKCYDKTREQRDKGNLGVEENLLRIEIVMLRRIIDKLFGENSTVQDVLCAKSIYRVMEEYSRIFNEEIVRHIKEGLTGISDLLFESLTQTDSPVETLAQFRDIVVDVEVLRKALKRWYDLRGRSDGSRQTIHSMKKYNLPQNVIATIKEFRKSCG